MAVDEKGVVRRFEQPENESIANCAVLELIYCFFKKSFFKSKVGIFPSFTTFFFSRSYFYERSL